MNAQDVNNNIQLIPLKKLVLSEYNVRTVMASKKDDKSLKASIAASGVVQNLVVHAIGNKYGVFAGGRRFSQLSILVKEKVITGDYQVPCSIKSDDEIIEISLAENMVRVNMHPADEFMAFNELHKEGKTIAEIAHKYGTTQINVKRRLRLACLSPCLIEKFKIGKLTLDQIIAFTVSEDHEKQIATYKELSPHNLSAYRIKNMLTDDALTTDDPLLKLVTKKVYTKAGGTFTDDIFEDVTYVNDIEILVKLAESILQSESEKIKGDGWKWAATALNRDNFSDYERAISAELKNVPKKITNAIKALEKEQEALEEIEVDDWTEENGDREDAIYDEIEVLEEKKENYRNYSKKQKSVSGVLVTQTNGVIVFQYGLVKKKDMAEAFPPAKSTNSGASTPTEQDGFSGEVESQALKQDLNTFKLQALQSEIMKDDKLSYDLMVFSLAVSFLNENQWCERPLSTSIDKSNIGSPDGIGDTLCNESIRQFEASLDITWLSKDSHADQFIAFRELSANHKKRILSYCSALSYQLHSHTIDNVRESISFDMSKHWKPTKDNYFKRIKTSDLLVIGEEQINKQWAVDNAKTAKGKLTDLLDGHDSMTEWMPESMK